MWLGLLMAAVLLVGCQAETDFDTVPEGGTETTADGY
jgi:hypothetical protein